MSCRDRMTIQVCHPEPGAKDLIPYAAPAHTLHLALTLRLPPLFRPQYPVKASAAGQNYRSLLRFMTMLNEHTTGLTIAVTETKVSWAPDSLL